MNMDVSVLYAFFLVFVRASAMLLSSPIFGAQHTPVSVRVFTTLSIAGALTMALQHKVGPVPKEMISLIGAVLNEAAAGLMLGLIISLVFFAIQMAGSFLDFQVGLGSSQILNPVTGVPVTVLAQFKFMLSVVVFLSMNGHHAMFRAFVDSYDAIPTLSLATMGALQQRLAPLIGSMSLLALQISAPVAAVSMIVDASLGMIGKAAPQMQVMLIGIPAKLILGFIALSVALPAVVSGVNSGVDYSIHTLWNVWRDAGK